MTIEKFTSEVIADLDLIIENPDGSKTVSIRLGKPFEKAPLQWSCQVDLLGLNPSSFEIAGMDSFNALSMALSFIGLRLKSTVQPNGKICYGKTSRDFGHSFPIEFYFPSLPTSEQTDCPDCLDVTP